MNAIKLRPNEPATAEGLARAVLTEMSARTWEVQEELRRTYARTYALASCVHDGLAVATEGGNAHILELLRSIRTYPARTV